MKSLIGKKLGMSQIFTEDGHIVPVTVIHAGPCTVVQTKDVETDGYKAVQVGYEELKENHTNKPIKGHFEKAGIKPVKYLKEFRLEDGENLEVGAQITVDVFAAGDKVDISGITKGKGYAGPIKKHGFSRGPMAHGSRYHRGPGALGPLGPNRVMKGRKLAGHMGKDNVTVQNLEVVKVDTERNLLLVKGAVPGPRKGLVTIKNSVKNS